MHQIYDAEVKVGRVLFVVPAIIVLLFLACTYAGNVAASVPYGEFFVTANTAAKFAFTYPRPVLAS
jgi:hypothetical protein